jgi:hypothetical protein
MHFSDSFVVFFFIFSFLYELDTILPWFSFSLFFFFLFFSSTHSLNNTGQITFTNQTTAKANKDIQAPIANATTAVLGSVTTKRIPHHHPPPPPPPPHPTSSKRHQHPTLVLNASKSTTDVSATATTTSKSIDASITTSSIPPPLHRRAVSHVVSSHTSTSSPAKRSTTSFPSKSSTSTVPAVDFTSTATASTSSKTSTTTSIPSTTSTPSTSTSSKSKSKTETETETEMDKIQQQFQEQLLSALDEARRTANERREQVKERKRSERAEKRQLRAKELQMRIDQRVNALRDHNDLVEAKEEEELKQAMELSLEEERLAKAYEDAYRRLTSSAPTKTPPLSRKSSSNKGKSKETHDSFGASHFTSTIPPNPPTLSKRSSSGRIKASAHPFQPLILNDKAEKTTSMAPCPVCSIPFPIAQIDAHLDFCLNESALKDMENEDTHPSTMDEDKTKKRSLPMGDEVMKHSPAAKKQSGEPLVDDLDCMIVDGPHGAQKRAHHFFYYSDGEKDEDEDTDENSLDKEIRYYARNPKSEQEEEELEDSYHSPNSYSDSSSSESEDSDAKDHLPPLYPASDQTPAAKRYRESIAFANRLGVVVSKRTPSSTRTKYIVPKSTKLGGSKSGTMAPAPSLASSTSSSFPTHLPKQPPITIPNSGGMFSEVPFKTDQPDKECPICFETFNANDVGVMLTCLCLYHHRCIASWFQIKPRNCPSHGDF